MEAPEKYVKYSPKLTMKTPEQCQWRLSGVFTANFEQVSHIVLEYL